MIPKDWLVEKVDASEAQLHSAKILAASGLSEAVVEQLLSKGTSPRWQELWDKFIDRKATGDELWFFESPRETWNNLSGSAGYALVRGGVVVETITSLRS